VAYVWGSLAAGDAKATGAVPVNHPAAWFVAMLRDGLAKRGIVVTGGTRAVNWLDREETPFDPAKMVEVASVESPPLSEMLKLTLKPSENLYAQLLLLQVGAHVPIGARTTEEAGMEAMRHFLTEAGVKRGTALLQEGSGLSRTGLVTPAATVQLLTFMDHHGAHREFEEALPIAGVDGTLRSRFRGTPAAGNVHAKTGSLEYVFTLSGYMTNKAGARLAFSIMLNNYRQETGGPSGRGTIDQFVRKLVDAP
jgi:D-alanyl-D-alanine carboxypeptidase/D-alanyl-D-alanine-endopeptidase (penicillin-binding protein 4)